MLGGGPGGGPGGGTGGLGLLGTWLMGGGGGGGTLDMEGLTGGTLGRDGRFFTASKPPCCSIKEYTKLAVFSSFKFSSVRPT